VTFEATDTGTRVSITHAGFGSADAWDEWLDGTSLGWDQAIADLYLYVETGVPARRFATRMHPPGMTMTERPAGLEVRTVTPGQLADRAGLQPGDLILRVADTPVFTIRELWVLMREHSQGEALTVDYVRDREQGHGVGVLTGNWT
jgi:S1-C subfamily serine protease